MTVLVDVFELEDGEFVGRTLPFLYVVGLGRSVPVYHFYCSLRRHLLS